MKKKSKIPLVVVGNKMDLTPDGSNKIFSTTVTRDWECGFIECSAKENVNVSDVFKELLGQIKLVRGEGLLLLGSGSRHCFVRTQSSPALPIFQKGVGFGEKKDELGKPEKRQLCKIS